jgi:hypothetical protein
LVAMRARKPWRRARTRFDGWKVRFIAFTPGHPAQTLIKGFEGLSFEARSIDAPLAQVNQPAAHFAAIIMGHGHFNPTCRCLGHSTGLTILPLSA